MIPKEYLGAFKAGHRKTSIDFIDEELAFVLLRKVQKDNCQKSKEALEFLTKFNNEYYKNVIKKGDPNAIHSSDELRLDCYDGENSRNRDMFTEFQNIGIDLWSLDNFSAQVDPHDQEEDLDF